MKVVFQKKMLFDLYFHHFWCILCT